MKQELVSIIIVNWNGKKWLKDCLDSLANQNYKNFEIILVDNQSEDDSVSFIKNNYQSVKIIENKKNVGFGTGNNLGVKNSRGEFLFFVNNDTRLPEDLLEKIVEFKKINRLNIVSPRILNTEKEDALRGGYLQIDIAGSPGGPSEKLFYVEGCSMLISRDDFEKLGGFDEKYFMYSEDIDLCWRAHILGMRMGVCEETKIIHFGGGSSQKTMHRKGERHVSVAWRRYEVEKNTLRNILKNYSFVNLFWVVPLFIMQDFFESLVYLLTGNFKVFASVWRAIGWNGINICDTLKERKRIQGNRIIGDSEILSMMKFGSYKLHAFLIVGMPKFK